MCSSSAYHFIDMFITNSKMVYGLPIHEMAVVTFLDVTNILQIARQPAWLIPSRPPVDPQSQEFIMRRTGDRNRVVIFTNLCF